MQTGTLHVCCSWRPAKPAVFLAVGLLAGAGAEAEDDLRFELTGFVGAEARLFTDPPVHPGQRRHAYSLVAQPELYWSWDDDSTSLTFTPFARLDSADEERSHFDVRELLWQRVGDDWELRLGAGKVFWGVTESVHLVDIINQTDLVENIDGEDKLGQPMVNLSLIRDWGVVDLFVLPYFRERTFPGRAGRLRTEPTVDTKSAAFESSRRQWHTDLAARWSHVIGPMDIGLYHFYGTSREPLLLPGLDSAGRPALTPFYEIIHQTGLDAQVTVGEWLLKLEALRRSGRDSSTFHALAAGFEYTFVGAFGTFADFGVLAEYLHDTRGDRSANPFENDVFAGMRLTFNDPQSTQVLAGVIQDLDGDSTVLSIEASRRIGDRWRAELEIRAWSGVSGRDTQFSLRDDDYVQFTLLRFF